MKQFLCVLSVVLCLSGCGTTRHTNPLTAAPEPIVKSQIASDDGKQDAGMESYDATGYIVRASWVERYHRLLTAYSKKLPVRDQIEPDTFMDGIEARGSKFHITYEVNSRFARLNKIDSETTP